MFERHQRQQLGGSCNKATPFRRINRMNSKPSSSSSSSAAAAAAGPAELNRPAQYRKSHQQQPTTRRVLEMEQQLDSSNRPGGRIEMDHHEHGQHEDSAAAAADTSSSLGGGGGDDASKRQLTNKLKSFVHMVMARKKENKLDSLEAMINESALKLLQQKELVFKQNNCLQLDQLCKTTKFSRRELKWLYSGWKVACTDGCGVSTDAYFGANESYGSHSLSSAYYGIINESQFQQIYAQFFPYGGDCSFYAKYVFQAMFGRTLDDNGGFITFGDYAHALSNLLRGSIEDKINFVFRLYDLNGDDVLTIDELSKIFFAIYRLLGDNVNQKHDQMTYEAQAEKFYKKIDSEETGAITKEQFMAYCMKNPTIVDTIKMLEMSICSSA